MHIGFDIRPLIFTKAGIAHYLYGLISYLSQNMWLQLHLFSSGKTNIKWNSSNIVEHLLRLPHLNNLCEQFWQEVLLPWAVDANKIDVFHGCRFHIPRYLHCPSVVTIHDLAFKKYPQFVVLSATKLFDRYITISSQKADTIIVLSETTKKDLINFYEVDPIKIRVIPLAPCIDYIPTAEHIEVTKQEFSIKGEYILFFGTIEPRKNLTTLIKAYANSSFKDKYYLVIAGPKGWLYEEVFKTAERYNLSNRIIFTGFVTEQQKACLYAGCKVFVFISWYEGFGIPVVEAMHFGKATVISNTSSLAEYFKDASCMVEPDSIESVKNALEQVLEDRHFREELEKRSREKVKEFSWQKTASLTLQVYKEVYDKRK
ncbi:MAG: glycosyltransferase family 4 protein [Candidatus Omnitrophica bacterium]|nr:glycosyltransferase family 4 protein [Candidatus Omnitrophota bacterium]